MLEERFLQPEGFKFKEFVTPDSVTHRYGHIRPKGDIKGTIVLLHGFSEFIEKYFETIRDLTAAGYAVYTFDWRGQGKSERYFENNFEQVYHDGFDKDAENLRYFTKVVIDRHDGPLFVLAHSMGAQIAVMTLKESPGLFDAAVLSAPMFRFVLPMPRFVAWMILGFIKLFRLEHKPVGRGGHWSYKRPPLAEDPRSHDPKRRLVHYTWCEQDPELRLGDISFQWVYHALKSVVLSEKAGFLESIKTPILIGIAGDDKIVDNRAARKAAARLPNAELFELDGAQHEILMERDVIRGEFLSKTLDFFRNHR